MRIVKKFSDFILNYVLKLIELVIMKKPCYIYDLCDHFVLFLFTLDIGYILISFRGQP